ncbi:pilus assembly protein [Acinetobacter cumulans]|uniref:PilC/PilY family type IV pilus protein n=1 Tax=Acinetobacter cumulans TaxID=2136182 RepID=UPI00148DC4F5|nr:PilC/PilY family type IV pilus protein [Acinetobacter cumulans]
MKTKKYKQGLVTSLTALSTAMLCQTATTYASDIEIYKAPTSGGATLMLVLDMSTSMKQPSNSDSSGYGNPINADFGIACSKSTAYEENISRTFVDSDERATQYSFKGTFCKISTTTFNGYDQAKKSLIQRSCAPISTGYQCSDRVTSLKESLFDLIIGTPNNQRLPSTASIGFRTFPTFIEQAPLVLTDDNRKILLNKIKDLRNQDTTPIFKAYATGSSDLFAHISASEAACAGYGVYFLTDGEPTSDSTNTSTRNLLNNYLSADGKVSSCSGSWQCVAAFAEPLQQKKNTENVEVKTAIVGFGKDFSFTHKNNSSQDVEYAEDQLAAYTNTWLAARFSGNALEAAKAAVKGRGGWYSANSKADIVSSVDNFVNSIKVPIPAITTGTSAIPQDVLNTSVIQPYAYFPQFQPKPSDDFRAWTGNLKKYNVSGGILKDKNNVALFGNAGVLNPANEDLWTPNYDANTTLTANQQSLKALGGLLSRLNLQKTDSSLNRKVFTSNGTTLTAVNEDYIKEDPINRGYYLGLLGYDITAEQVQRLTSNFDLSQLPQTTSELRQIGAVMHSTPVLLTQSGKVSYVAAQAAQAATTTTAAVAARDAYMDTTNRDDYILFGTTQGVLHVVKAGKSDEITTVGNTAGQEVFAFVPQEMLATQGKAFLDPPQTVDATNTSSNGMNHLYYGVDGAWTAHTEYVYNTADETFKVYDSDTKFGKQWVYGGLRMGGRSYYALDLTNMDLPTVKFRINPVNSSVDGFATPSSPAETARYANLAKMGQSWSKPTIANVQWKGKRRLVMFVGGGYDPGYETFNYNQTNGMGAGVYMFDANTGEFLWSTYDAVKTPATTGTTLIGDGDYLKYSVVSQIKGVDRDGDGDVDHLYFGDLGGQVFRVDLNSTHGATDTVANYASQITRIYNGHVDGGVSPRFYEMPAFTVYQGTGGLFAVISIGSGNRSTPLLGKQVNGAYIVNGETTALNTTLTDDAIYNIYDTVVTTKTPATATLGTSPTRTNLFAITDSNRELNAITAVQTTPANLAANKETSNYKGWYYAFTSSTGRKAIEKVQGDLIAIDNDLYVSTFNAEGTDSTASCGAGIYGTSRAHRFCMPYGQCQNTDNVTGNTLELGKGLLGITMGPGSDPTSRRVIASLGVLPSSNKITGTIYRASNQLIPQSWYEKN